jgi:tetratricopeptide (TPR) repeat protein
VLPFSIGAAAFPFPMADDTTKVLPLREGWRRHLSRGARFLQQGRFGEAAEAFERALREAPEEPQTLLALGRERARQGRYHEAEHLLRAALERQPASAAAAASLARVLGLHQGRREEAFQVVHAVLPTCSEPGPLHVIRGELLLEEGTFGAARAAFGQALDDPLSGEAARVGMARTYNAEGIALSERLEYEPAVFSFKRAADLDPEWSGPHVNLGVVFGRMGKLGKAVEAYMDALHRDPQNPVALFNLGTAQKELGRHADAIRALEELLLLAPDYPHARAALANVLGEMREFDRAIALLLEELDIDQRCVSCWSSLGLAYICSGNAERGEQCLRRALEIDPGYFNAIRNLAVLYVTQRRYEAAERLLEGAFRLDPERTTQLVTSDRHFESIRAMEQFRFLEGH